MKLDIVLNVAGDGYWSSVKKSVRVTELQIGYVSDDHEYGELRVYFETNTWDTAKVGLIYSDSLFMRELRGALTAHQLPGKDVAYSEQGMQGDDYVSCDVGKKFLGAWAAKFNIKWDEVLADPRGIRAACIG